MAQVLEREEKEKDAPMSRREVWAQAKNANAMKMDWISMRDGKWRGEKLAWIRLRQRTADVVCLNVYRRV